ncbi:phosphatidate cytidylyltransferase [Hydrogenobaculum acidophilum]
MNREYYGFLVGVGTLAFLLSFKFITLLGLIILSFFVAKELKDTSKASTNIFLAPIIMLISTYNLAYGFLAIFLVVFLELLISKNIDFFYKSFFILNLSSILPSFIYKVKELGNHYVLGLLLSVWILDTMSYYIGKNFGKHKLAPSVSPNKTIEGFIGGSTFCILFDIFYFGFSKGLIVGIAISLVGVFGDLFKSLIKRQYNIKDFSNVFGPHGGFLDRFDALMFSAVVFYMINASH